ncbi:SH3 domain-containing protein [Desulfobaculum bizertense]|uniref:SH3 domain-containing C40 family peptidase n=1 Tax=Desulfobaculum bizertense TaxID=376490 RepID=UPI001F4580FA|nr:SH3 domain-containing protein [Desulfobaculum bizertense]UIJ37686.1 SH3 domain-containing protein [Desulfobaculum bizertense]
MNIFLRTQRKALHILAVVAVLGFCLHLTGCVSGQRLSPQASLPIEDLSSYSQLTNSYIDPLGGNSELLTPDQAAEQAQYMRRMWFSPWHRSTPGAAAYDIPQYLKRVDPSVFYGEDMRPYSSAWKQKLELRSQLRSFPNSGFAAITIRNTALRLFPTRHPAFRDFRKAGQGWPFDLLQNTGVWSQTPVYISHISQDGAWLLAETHYAAGWLPAEDIVQVSPSLQRRLESSDLSAVIVDNSPLTDVYNLYRGSARIGMLMPEVDGKLLLVVPDASHQASVVQVQAPPMSVQHFPYALTERHLSQLADSMIGQRYGWGGLYQNRDCSSLLMDLYLPFGIRLPRNSFQQAKSTVSSISFEGLERSEKLALIKEKAIPWMTLFWKPGHIMLYIGEKDGVPLMYHAMWGLATRSRSGEEGRLVIGRVSITSLVPGREDPCVTRTGKALIDSFQQMSFLPVKVE